MNFKEWNKKNYDEYIKYLKTLEDKKYKDFNSKLIPNITQDKIIGIRIPMLRKIAKTISKSDYQKFLKLVKNKYFEETLIEGLVISNIKDTKEFKNCFEYYIYKIDNWETCDTFCNSLKIININKKYFFNYFKDFLSNNAEYVIRCILIIFLNFYIEEEYIKEIFEIVNNIKSSYYYSNMGIAWLISMIYVKYPSETLIFLNNNNLSDFTHNKSIQKIIESTKVSNIDKNNLRKLKR